MPRSHTNENSTQIPHSMRLALLILFVCFSRYIGLWKIIMEPIVSLVNLSIHTRSWTWFHVSSRTLFPRLYIKYTTSRVGCGRCMWHSVCNIAIGILFCAGPHTLTHTHIRPLSRCIVKAKPHYQWQMRMSVVSRIRSISRNRAINAKSNWHRIIRIAKDFAISYRLKLIPHNNRNQPRCILLQPWFIPQTHSRKYRCHHSPAA